MKTEEKGEKRGKKILRAGNEEVQMTGKLNGPQTMCSKAIGRRAGI
jgi:hypothetical protein